MKLKKAIRKARKLGYNWIAVDQSGMICRYKEEPEIIGELWDTTEDFQCIGGYTGGKNWKDTLRRCYPEATDVSYDPQKDIVQKDRDEFMDAWEFGLNRLDDMKTEFKERAQADEAQIPEDWKLPKGNGGSTSDPYDITQCEAWDTWTDEWKEKMLKEYPIVPKPLPTTSTIVEPGDEGNQVEVKRLDSMRESYLALGGDPEAAWMKDVESPEADDEADDEANGGSTPEQYGIPEGSKDLQDLIEYRGMTWNLANVFKANYRVGCKNTKMYELRKMKWFIDREIKLEESK